MKFLAAGIQIVNCLSGLHGCHVRSLVEWDSEHGLDQFCMSPQEMDVVALVICQKPQHAQTSHHAETMWTVYGVNGVHGVTVPVNVMVE